MKSITSRKTEQIDKHISWVKKLTEGGVFTKPKIEIDGRDVKSNLSYDKTIQKKMAYSMSFLESRFDFSKNTISVSESLPVSLQAIQRKLGLDWVKNNPT